jgi:hypothetical protein
LPNGRSSRVILNVGNTFIKNPHSDHEIETIQNNQEHDDSNNNNNNRAQPHESSFHQQSRHGFHHNEDKQQQQQNHAISFEYNVEKGVDSNVELSCGLHGDDENPLKWRKLNGVNLILF